jgi:hypothetical protein
MLILDAASGTLNRRAGTFGNAKSFHLYCLINATGKNNLYGLHIVSEKTGRFERFEGNEFGVHTIEFM